MAASAFFILLVSTMSCYEAQRQRPPVKVPDCRSPPKLQGLQLEGGWNGKINPSYACLPGYIQDAPIQVVCLAGMWMHIGGQCKAISCKPPQVDNGRVNYPIKPAYNNNDVIQITCNEGFYITNGQSTCTKDGWIPKPTCTAISCKPPQVDNGRVNYPIKPAYNNNDVIQITCNEGFYITNGQSTCTKDGWIPKPTCTAISCKPPQVDNGRVTYPLKPAYNNNDVIQITCNEGFYITNGQSTCTKDGWIPKPTCTEIVCNSYQHVEKGRLISVQAAYKYGEEIDVECDSGYILQTEPNKRRTCTTNGWSPPIRCVAYCEPPPAVQNAILNEQPKSSYASGEKVTYTCNGGYSLEGSLTGEAQCQSTQWINVPVCRKSCQTPEIVNGFLATEQQDSYDSGSSVAFWCNENYVINGPINAKCENGQWIDLPVCYRPCRISSEGLSESNIQLHSFYIQKSTYDSNYKHGTELLVSCKPGFKRPNQALLKIACYDGKFKYPRCFSGTAYCEPPPAVQNAILNEQPEDSYASGEKVTYTCNGGYSLEGSLTGEAQCQSTQWINVPVCRKIGEQCGPPPTIQFGDTLGIRKPSYKSGESVEYRCPNYHILKGEKVVRCMNGVWEEAPVCLEIGEQCGPPPTVQFGDTLGIRKPSYKSGESVEYRCPNYHILKGEKVVRCMNGVWEEAPVCLEPCTAKEKDMEENRIQLRWVSDKKVYSKHGDETEFVCKPEHEAPPGTLMKTTCQQGKLQYPKCFRNGFCVLQQATMITNNINSNMNNVVDHEQTIRFQCNEGMMPEDKLEAKCESGNINYPKCSSASKSAVYAESCQTPEIVNGFLATERQDSYNSGSSVAFECNENYVINGPINAKCENGQWTDLPVCYRPCKISSEGLSESNIQLHSFYIQKSTYDSNYKHGTELLVSCKPGFKRPNQALLKIICYDGKFKYPRCFSGNICRITQEGLDQNNLDLHEVHDNEVLYMECEKIYFKCKNGFYHWGQPTGTCAELAVSYPKCSASSSV
ncbi:coagulation factor XIII B chain-like isoform X4 [Eleutherodactylus coqui]|uniref:coagulation factor XIII B chain-like isoform X4 n=1 Tax=Eleutherodactylus coqui TaxID=57060 RepID=UPI003462B5E4